MTTTLLHAALQHITSGHHGHAHDMSAEQAFHVFHSLLQGEEPPLQIAAFLGALAAKGESVEEIVGAARALRENAISVTAPAGAIDTCGTGGDNSGTYNISTAVAFVVAACGVPVAKHGNRKASSASGSADVLQALGVNIEASKATVEYCLKKANIGFLFAPKHHQAMRHVAPIRQTLGIRTIFNIIGPLANPAAAPYQLIGVFNKQWLAPLAHAVKQLGVQKAWIVHGGDGLDEITVSQESFVVALENGKIRSFSVHPRDAGLPTHPLEALQGGDSLENAAALKQVLQGTHNAYRDIVLLNSAAALVIAGKAPTLSTGVKLAAQAIDSGNAYNTLNALIECSHVIV